MPGARVGLARIVALGFCLALALLLFAAREANAAKYSVAQCGWGVDADAGWWDSTGGAKFRSDGYCVPPPGHDPFDGIHLKSFTRGGSTVSGTRFARWRWEAPPGTGITRVSGTWWHALHDGMEQRIGMGTAAGGFVPFLTASTTDVALRDFVAGFSTPQPALEDRLLCARGADRWCSVEPGSWSGIRALTITIQDDVGPGAWVWGELVAGGWLRGAHRVMFSGTDDGGGVRFAETLLDDSRIHLHEYACAKALIGSEWRGTRMRPCGAHGADGVMVDTARFSDGSHRLHHCTTDFAGNVGCTGQQTIKVDNHAPAHPRALALIGGDGWRRVNDFDLAWTNPDQGAGSPITAALWRIRGPAGYDSGVKTAARPGVTNIADRSVPAPGVYAIDVWLRDEAGNEAPPSAVSVPLRFDNVPPGIAFEVAADDAGAGLPATVRVDVSDQQSGPAGGKIFFRRLDREQWVDLPTELVAGEEADEAQLVARVPGDLEPGIYVFRADSRDAAGNTASTTRRADGTEMSLRQPAAPPGPPTAIATSRPAAAPARSKTRLFAHLRWHQRRGESLSVPFEATGVLAGRLVTAEGAGLAGRRLRVVARPSRGALAKRRVEVVETGRHGGFRLPLPAGTSRRITVGFRGDAELAGSRRAALALRVRGGISLAASPRQLETGELIHLWGRVRTRGAPIPRRGKLVAIQYFEHAARRWRPVLVVRSDHGGRFRARYRFRYVSGLARIRLRAVALAEERWPYAPGASKPVLARVSGP
ncbi:MAG TPA: hypothetical protein VFY04_08635 [Solirubrobacterales bacterium]|nr:hypothetical protein [Solirubrobacterales bacterium]